MPLCRCVGVELYAKACDTQTQRARDGKRWRWREQKGSRLNQVFGIISASLCRCLCIFGTLFHHRLLYMKILFVRSIRCLHNDFWLQFVCCSAIKLLMLMTKNAFARNASANRPTRAPCFQSRFIFVDVTITRSFG